jgi:hypothetical protein
MYANSETIKQQQQQHTLPLTIQPDYHDMYTYGQNAVLPMMAPMYNMGLVGGPGAHLPKQGQHQLFVNNVKKTPLSQIGYRKLIYCNSYLSPPHGKT